MKIYCVYIHQKLNNGEPFYVGKGKLPRATTHAGRSKHWHRIVEKHGKAVRIAKSNMSEPCAFTLERALIATYGRSNLCNQTDGGEGTSGRIISDAHKAKCAASNKGTKPSPHSIDMARERNSKLIGTRCGLRFSSATNAAKALRPDIWRAAKINICGCAAGHTKHAYGLEWGYIKDGKPIFLYVNKMSEPRPKKWRAIRTAGGLRFDAIGHAVDWLKSTGFEKANTGAICRAAKYGKNAYGLGWSYA